MRRAFRHLLLLAIANALSLAFATSPTGCGDLMCGSHCVRGADACFSFAGASCPTDRGCQVVEACRCASPTCDDANSSRCSSQSQARCTEVSGCALTPTCTGTVITPAECTGLDEDDCNARSGCRYERNCN